MKKFKLNYYISKLALTHIEDIHKYFSETTLGVLKQNYDFYEPGIVWDNNTTLEQVFKYVTNYNPIYSKSIYKLYELICSNKIDVIDDYNKIPEGIVELDFNQMCKKNYNRFKERCINTDVYLPKTLKRLVYGNFFKDANVSTLYVNEELEVLKPNESNIELETIELKAGEYKQVPMRRELVQLPKNTSYMYNNKYINHVVIPTDSRLFDYKENIWNFCDYYVVKPIKSVNIYRAYSLYLYSIPRFNYLSVMDGNIQYSSEQIEKELSSISYYWEDDYKDFLLDKVYRHTILMLPDRYWKENYPRLIKKWAPSRMSKRGKTICQELK